jgi:hypothetical protein
MIESKQVLEWQNQAVVRASQEDLCALLAKRFGMVPESVRKRIEATTHRERLHAAILQVFSIDSSEELQL